MPVASLLELHKGICELAGFSARCAEHEERRSYSLRFSGIQVTAMAAGEGSVLLIAELGAMPAHDALAGWLVLMDANAFLMDVDSARFSRNPVTGQVVLHRKCRLDRVSVPQVYQLIMRMVELARAWRDDPLLAATPTPSDDRYPPAVDTMLAKQAAADFRRLHAGICELLDGPAVRSAEEVEAEVGKEAGEQRFEIDASAMGLRAGVAHSAHAQRGFAFVGVRLGNAPEPPALENVIELMEANFALMNDTQGTMFCRDPGNGEFMVMYAHPLADVDAGAFLRRLAVVLATCRDWHGGLAPGMR